MERCHNCKHLTGMDCCWFCRIEWQEIPHPMFMGGSGKCECYERACREKSPFRYPKKRKESQ